MRPYESLTLSGGGAVLAHEPDVAIFQAGFNRNGVIAWLWRAEDAVLDAIVHLQRGNHRQAAVRPFALGGD